MCETIKEVKLMRDYFKICSVVAVASFVLLGCRTDDASGSEQLKGYINSNSHESIRQESADSRC